MPDTSIINKLGIKSGYKLLIMHAPEGYIASLGQLPEGVVVSEKPDGMYDFVQLFVKNKDDIDHYGLGVIKALKPGGMLWYTYPKKTSGFKTDISRDSGWDAVYAAGYHQVSICSLGDIWSAFRFRPVEDIKSMSK